ncbi:MAG: methylated-DNA--[protein]-cysteine S-methyltransferase [Alphaproteobacteria bacterium]|nr:methylated-DNA--[protein]-cysteine S-methyltransferase [Alphaproteobacteria bacterium]MBO6626786.1 methylated-DNA--[protein]-cysteine S-methyltransferase [Alphaproteobacteria bacterium]MDF1627641.1 methylated-DNA--[protein]-cysteine S-methyltransferase [Parvibaculaceae bacterium]
MPKSTTPLYVQTIETPIGPIRIGTHAAGLARVLFAKQEDEVLLEDTTPGEAARAHMKRTVAALEDYFAGRRKTFDDITLAPEGTAFQLSVWTALTKLKFGETCAYRDIATEIGNPKAVRAVGLANGQNPIPVIVPCHRVIGANGKLTGFGGGLPAKQWLLAHEGAIDAPLL